MKQTPGDGIVTKFPNIVHVKYTGVNVNGLHNKSEEGYNVSTEKLLGF
jgi:hypothetical protein